MMSNLACTNCQQSLEPDDRFCIHCGQTTAQIVWSCSQTTRPGQGIVPLSPGGTLYLVALNTGSDTARLRVDTTRLRGLRLVGTPERKVDRHQSVAFTLKHEIGEDIRGSVQMFSSDGKRPCLSEQEPESPWWERYGERGTRLFSQAMAQIVEERWIIGSPTLLFPPDVQKQYIRIWNDSDQKRTFYSEVPIGYRISNFGTAIEKSSPDLFESGTIELMVEAERGRPGKRNVDSEWLAGPEAEAIPLVRTENVASARGADIIVAIDFGTRNTGVRVRWRRELITGKPKGTVDFIGEGESKRRFPTEMALHRNGGNFRWGADVPRGLLPKEEIRIENLKTLLRVNENLYTRENPRWTNAHLLERYFEEIFVRLDEYFRTADPNVPLERQELNVRYIMTRPVLDANEGDTQGKLYEQTLTMALERCNVRGDQITFVHEPKAAALGIAKQRAKELLALGDGAAIAVIDAGGGTTDVAIARISLREGQLALDIQSSYALNIDNANPALAAVQHFGVDDRREFGGNVLDYALTYRLLTDATDLLETDGLPVPPRLELLPLASSPEEKRGRETELVVSCRTMKEDFAYVSTHYLTRTANPAVAEHGTSIFANRPEYEGITLEHTLFGKVIIAPILGMPIQELRERIEQDAYRPEGIRPSQVRKVFYVGGTNIDFYVREQFQEAFPNSPRLKPEAMEGIDERILERLNAVIDGAVWWGEPLFAASPLTLVLRLNEVDKLLLQQGDPLPVEPKIVPPLPVQLEPGQELEATLTATGNGLKEPICVARGFYRNTSETLQEGRLEVQISQEKGMIAQLKINNRTYDQWHFALVGAIL